ncbi:MAG: flagellar biosynthesis anti-sigma factor FlgM [Chloroflexota bacterium]
MHGTKDQALSESGNHAHRGASISPHGQALQTVGSEVREQLVRRLRSEIDAGTYGPSGQQVARRMLAALGNIFRS